ncbi:MAG: PAS domain-containing protein [Burkholderiales bacterium]|nr:MAG: PAS domain-containing protein [Burkholderiales bacterium]
MSWITVVWSMIAAVCLSFAAVHLLVWLRSRDTQANLLFAISAGAAGALTVLELVAMRAATPAAYGEALRWMHVAVAIVVIAIVWFLRAYLQAGRIWLAWTITGLRALVLVPNFFAYPNATFGEISAVTSFTLWGESVSVPVGEPNPWRILIEAINVLLVVYVVDAVVKAWRQGDRRRGLTIGCAIVAAAILAATFSQLMVLGLLPGPFTGLVFMLIVIAMGWELSLNVIQAGELAHSLRESQQRMEMVTRAVDLGLWEWDIVRDKVWANERARAWVGFGESASVTFDASLERIHLEDREATREAVLRVLGAGDDLRVEFRIAVPDGETRWNAAQGKVERGANGKPVRLRGVSMDVTARRRDEAELLRQREDLARLQRASAMGQLSNALAHELNQPLGAILRNAEAAELFLRKEPPDLEELRAIVADIRRDDQRAAAVIDRMRALLRRGSLRFETIALRELAAHVAALMRAEIQARQVILDVNVPDELPCIRGDRIHLQQVLLNLLLNSLEAVQGLSEQRRRLSVEASERGDGHIEVAVRDRGPGFPVEQISSVFDPFVTTKSGGTGLGLAISKTIIEAHGGRIWAENDPQGGATVRFTLQAARAGDAA